MSFIKDVERDTISQQPNLSKRGFWDINLETLDFNRYADFIITRVFERGSKRDVQNIINYYWEEDIINTLGNSASLLPIAKERAKQFFHLSDKDFACSTSKQPARSLSKY